MMLNVSIVLQNSWFVQESKIQCIHAMGSILPHAVRQPNTLADSNVLPPTTACWPSQ